MAQDKLEIINRAATELAAARIMSVSDQAKTARTMDAVYDGERDAALAGANWLFAMRKFNPAQSATAPLFGYTYSYVIPEECLRLVEIKGIYVGSPSLGPRYIGESDKLYEREDDKIHINEGAPLNCRGVFRITNEAKFDPLFIQYFVMCLAIAGHNDLTRKGGTSMELLMTKQRTARRMAVRNNAIQEPPEEIPDDSWIMSRVGP